MLTDKDRQILNKYIGKVSTRDEFLDVIELLLSNFYDNIRIEKEANGEPYSIWGVVRGHFPEPDDLIDKFESYYNTDDLLDAFTYDDRLDSLKDTWTLDEYVNDIVDERLADARKEWEEEINTELNTSESKKTYIDMTPDDVRVRVCDFLGVASYCDDKKIDENLKNMMDKIKKSCYTK